MRNGAMTLETWAGQRLIVENSFALHRFGVDLSFPDKQMPLVTKLLGAPKTAATTAEETTAAVKLVKAAQCRSVEAQVRPSYSFPQCRLAWISANTEA